MLPSINNDKNDDHQHTTKPIGVWLYLIFFTLVIAHFLFIILMHSLGLMPNELANHDFFSSNGFYLNFVGNLILAIMLLVSLFQMKQSAMFWSLALFVFDLLSTSFWILTQNWLETAGNFGPVLVGFVWGGCITCYLYLGYLNKKGLLTPCSVL